MIEFRSAPSPSAVAPYQPGLRPELSTERTTNHPADRNPARFVRRQLTPADGRALEILSHAIEYLADEYALDPLHAGFVHAGPMHGNGDGDAFLKGRLGRADPRVEAIQVLKALNRAIYYSGSEVQPIFRRVRRWFLGARKGVLAGSR